MQEQLDRYYKILEKAEGSFRSQSEIMVNNKDSTQNQIKKAIKIEKGCNHNESQMSVIKTALDTASGKTDKIDYYIDKLRMHIDMGNTRTKGKVYGSNRSIDYKKLDDKFEKNMLPLKDYIDVLKNAVNYREEYKAQNGRESKRLDGAIDLGMKQQSFNYSDAIRSNSDYLGMFHQGFQIQQDKTFLEKYVQVTLAQMTKVLDEKGLKHFEFILTYEWQKVKTFFNQELAQVIIEDISNQVNASFVKKELEELVRLYTPLEAERCSTIVRQVYKYYYTLHTMKENKTFYFTKKEDGQNIFEQSIQQFVQSIIEKVTKINDNYFEDENQYVQFIDAYKNTFTMLNDNAQFFDYWINSLIKAGKLKIDLKSLVQMLPGKYLALIQIFITVLITDPNTLHSNAESSEIPDEKKTRPSQTKSKLFILKASFELQKSLGSWDKIGKLVQEHFNKMYNEALKSYISYCWAAGMKELVPVANQITAKNKIVSEYKKKFKRFENILHALIENHKKYIENLSEDLKEIIRNLHMKTVHNPYKTFQTTFVNIPDIEKVNVYKYNTNEVTTKIRDCMLKY